MSTSSKPSSPSNCEKSKSAKHAAEKVIKKAAEKWKSSFVARSQVREFSGGLYSPGYLANCDSIKKGPKGAFRVGRQVAYPVESLIEFLITRLEM